MALTPTKEKKTRKAAEPKPVYVVFQVLDDMGEPMEFAKSRIRVLSASRKSDAALEAIENRSNPYATFLRVMVGK